MYARSKSLHKAYIPQCKIPYISSKYTPISFLKPVLCFLKTNIFNRLIWKIFKISCVVTKWIVPYVYPLQSFLWKQSTIINYMHCTSSFTYSPCISSILLFLSIAYLHKSYAHQVSFYQKLL